MAGELYSDDPTFVKTWIGRAVGTEVKQNKRNSTPEYIGVAERRRD